MTTFVIEGGHPIQGTITPIGNKNAALPLISACLLTDEPITLHNVPLIGDVSTMFDILSGLGVEIEYSGDSVTLCARHVHNTGTRCRTLWPDPRLADLDGPNAGALSPL